MWSPTHIKVTVQKAKNILTKGKNGTNNCFVTIGLGKEKYQTSIKEKATQNVDWHEECELTIPNQGNRAELTLTCLHHNNLGLDEFLGQCSLPLNEMDVYESPRARWYKLQSKPGKEKKKERGELEIRVAFTVKSGSLTDLSKKEKHKSSLGKLASSVGGSLLSIGTLEKRKGLKKFAKSLGSKVHMSGKSKKDKHLDSDSNSGSFTSIGTPGSNQYNPRLSRQTLDDADPGVISEDEDEFTFDNLSHKSSGSSLNMKGYPTSGSPAPVPSLVEDTKPKSVNIPTRITETTKNEWEEKLYGKHLDIGNTDSLKRRSWENSRVPLAVTQETDETEEIIIPPQNNTAPNTPTLKEKIKVEQSSIEEKSIVEDIKPKPLPRSGTLESITEKEIEIKQEKPIKVGKTDKENIFTKKLKYFRKETKPDFMEDFKFNKADQKHYNDRIIVGHENQIKNGNTIEISNEIIKKYEGKTKEEIMLIAHNLENEVRSEKSKIKEMEDYLDNLLLRVMETHPRILQNPYRAGQNKRCVKYN